MAPFFVFQVLCLFLWSLDDYWYYSVFTLLLLMFFEGMLCKQRQASLLMLRNMRRPPIDMYVLPSHFHSQRNSLIFTYWYSHTRSPNIFTSPYFYFEIFKFIDIFRYALRAGIWVGISSEELVPGDVISLKAPVPKKPRKKRSKLTLFSSFLAAF